MTDQEDKLIHHASFYGMGEKRLRALLGIDVRTCKDLAELSETEGAIQEAAQRVGVPAKLLASWTEIALRLIRDDDISAPSVGVNVCQAIKRNGELCGRDVKEVEVFCGRHSGILGGLERIVSASYPFVIAGTFAASLSAVVNSYQHGRDSNETKALASSAVAATEELAKETGILAAETEDLVIQASRANELAIQANEVATSATVATERIAEETGLLAAKTEGLVAQAAYANQLAEQANEAAAKIHLDDARDLLGQNPYQIGLIDPERLPRNRTVWAQIREKLDLAQSIAPGLSEIDQLGVVLLVASGRLQDAELVAARLHSGDPSVSAARTLASIQDLRQNLLGAMGTLEKAAGKYPNDVEVMIDAGVIKAKLGSGDEAEDYFQGALDIDAESARAHMNFGALLERFGKYDDAAKHYKMAVSADRMYVKAYLTYAVFLEGPGADRVNSELYLRAALNIDPSNAVARQNLLAMGVPPSDVERAVASLREDVLADPHNPRTHLLLGAELKRFGDLVESEWSLREACRLEVQFAQSVSASLALGKLLFDKYERFASEENAQDELIPVLAEAAQLLVRELGNPPMFISEEHKACTLSAYEALGLPDRVAELSTIPAR